MLPHAPQHEAGRAPTAEWASQNGYPKRPPDEDALLQASKPNPRDHLIFSLALGTGLRLAEIVGLNVGDVFTADGTPRSRIRLRREIAKGGRAGDVFLPDALGPKRPVRGGRRERAPLSAGPGLKGQGVTVLATRNPTWPRFEGRRIRIAHRRS